MRIGARRLDGQGGTALIHILYFAWLRERTGCGEEAVPFRAEVATVGALVEALRARSAGYASAFARPRLVRCAVNQVFAGPDTPISDGDEVAFFPPVTGG